MSSTELVPALTLEMRGRCRSHAGASVHPRDRWGPDAARENCAGGSIRGGRVSRAALPAHDQASAASISTGGEGGVGWSTGTCPFRPLARARPTRHHRGREVEECEVEAELDAQGWKAHLADLDDDGHGEVFFLLPGRAKSRLSGSRSQPPRPASGTKAARVLCKPLRNRRRRCPTENKSPGFSGAFLMERIGIEPMTSALQRRRSPS